jgi:hypothetical protein
MNLCTKKNRRIDLLERKIKSMVDMYRQTPRMWSETFSVVFPGRKLEGKKVNVYRWTESKSKPEMKSISLWK